MRWLTCDDEACLLSLLWVELGECEDGQFNVLLSLESVDAENNLSASTKFLPSIAFICLCVFDVDIDTRIDNSRDLSVITKLL